MTNTAWDQPSSYFESSTNFDKADYKRKLTLSMVELLLDPFTIKNWKCDESLLPDISWPDIYNYLIQYPSVFSKESLKAYKSLEGHNFFISGHVQEVIIRTFLLQTKNFALLKVRYYRANVKVRNKSYTKFGFVFISKRDGY